MKPIIFSIKDIVNILKSRQKNEFDGNIVVSGDRGNGKSTLISKVFYRFGGFNPWKHQVYNRDDVINLLKSQQYGLCFDDEAVNSGYKRDFQDKAQQELIKIITAYRDNFNIYASAIPNFFNLDKDLRDLTFLLLYVIEKGMAVVHMPLQGRMYSRDRWDSDNNKKKEMKYIFKHQKDPTFKFPHYRLSTFRGYLYFGDLPTLQKELYKQVKIKKRSESFITEEKEKDDPFEHLVQLVIGGRLTREGLMQYAAIHHLNYASFQDKIRRRLITLGYRGGVSSVLAQQKATETQNSSVNTDITTILPS